MLALYPGFKKKCRIPVLKEGRVNTTSPSEPADPARPLFLGSQSSGTRWDMHTWTLESDLGLSRGPSAMAVRWPELPVRAWSGCAGRLFGTEVRGMRGNYDDAAANVSIGWLSMCVKELIPSSESRQPHLSAGPGMGI